MGGFDPLGKVPVEQGPPALHGWLKSAHATPVWPGNSWCSCAVVSNKCITLAVGLKKEENQSVVSSLREDGAGGVSWANRLLEPGRHFGGPGYSRAIPSALPAQGLSQERADLAGKVVLELHIHGSGSPRAGPVVQSSRRACPRGVLGAQGCWVSAPAGPRARAWVRMGKCPAVGSTGRRSACPAWIRARCRSLLRAKEGGPSATAKLPQQRDPPALHQP